MNEVLRLGGLVVEDKASGGFEGAQGRFRIETWVTIEVSERSKWSPETQRFLF